MFIIEMVIKCDNVISLKQYGPTCWFNSILMSVLYSDESRKLLLEKSKKWNKEIAIYKTLSFILKNKYFRTTHIHNDYLYFDKIRPEYILKQLYNYNKKKFSYDPVKYKDNGFKSALYIKSVYKLLGVKVLYIDLNPKTKKIYYSKYNNTKLIKITKKVIKFDYVFKSPEKVQEKIDNHDIIIINILDGKHIKKESYYPPHYLIEKVLDEILNLNETVKIKNEEYIQDSILLTNWNKNTHNNGGHSIAGIKCKGEKYVYNGWTRTTIDPNIVKELISDDKKIAIPCQLMKYKWDLKNKDSFCLNRKKCILDIMDAKNLCFSFYEGGRIVTYIKKNKSSDFDINGDIICNNNKVVNPLTNRCISIKSINKLPIKPLSKPEIPKKICPEGTFLNPITNRCNKIKIQKKSAKPKEPIKPTRPEKIEKIIVAKICPEGTFLNPITNRCNKIKIQKKSAKPKEPIKPTRPEKIEKIIVAKICPEGSVLNPITNRCNKIKIQKK